MALGWLWWRTWFMSDVTDVPFPDICLYFAWYLWHWAGSGGALGFRRGAGDTAAVGVIVMGFGDIHLCFTWQVWYLVASISILAW